MKQKFAICNEVFGAAQDVAEWRRVCEFVAGCGYDGIEVAPFTFAPSVQDIAPEQRRDIRRITTDAGLEIVGLHWLLVSPPGLHINARDDNVRRRTADYLRHLTDFAGDLGARVMIFGSPKQRFVEDDYQNAWRRAQDSYREVLPTLEARHVILCQESLPAPECDFILTAQEAKQMVDEINHPHFCLMLDAKSMAAEESTPAEIIRRFGREIEHFHANDANRRAPGYGDTDFRPIAAALRECEYSHYVSIEPFDYWPNPQTLAHESLNYLREAFEI